MELGTARDKINDCIRDGIPQESGYTLRLEMVEHINVETATRFVWVVGYSAIEATPLTRDLTQLKLIPVMEIYDDGVASRDWNQVHQYFKRKGLVRQFQDHQDDLEGLFEYFREQDLVRGARPELPDEQEYEEQQRNELKTNQCEHGIHGRPVTNAEIESIVQNMWQNEVRSSEQSQARWDKIHSFDGMTPQEATQKFYSVPSTQSESNANHTALELPRAFQAIDAATFAYLDSQKSLTFIRHDKIPGALTIYRLSTENVGIFAMLIIRPLGDALTRIEYQTDVENTHKAGVDWVNIDNPRDDASRSRWFPSAADKRDFERRFNSLDGQLTRWVQNNAKWREESAQERATFAVSFFEKYRAHLIREFAESGLGEPEMSKKRGIRKATPEENRNIDTYKVVIRILERVFMRLGFRHRILHESPDGSRVDLAIARSYDLTAILLLDMRSDPDLTLDWHTNQGDLKIMHGNIDRDLLAELKEELSKVGLVSETTWGTMAVQFNKTVVENFGKSWQDPNATPAPADMATHESPPIMDTENSGKRRKAGRSTTAMKVRNKKPTGQTTDFVEQRILNIYQELMKEGMHPSDEEIAARLPQSRKGQAFTRETVNRKRQAMRKRGIDV